jgi:hypothetical protein
MTAAALRPTNSSTYGTFASAGGRPGIVGTDSLLARTALELAERHPISPGADGEPWCLNCWAPWPCGPAQHAREVCNAAGVAPPEVPREPDRHAALTEPLPSASGIGGRGRAAY